MYFSRFNHDSPVNLIYVFICKIAIEIAKVYIYTSMISALNNFLCKKKITNDNGVASMNIYHPRCWFYFHYIVISIYFSFPLPIHRCP